MEFGAGRQLPQCLDWDPNLRTQNHPALKAQPLSWARVPLGQGQDHRLSWESSLSPACSLTGARSSPPVGLSFPLWVKPVETVINSPRALAPVPWVPCASSAQPRQCAVAMGPGEPPGGLQALGAQSSPSVGLAKHLAGIHGLCSHMQGRVREGSGTWARPRVQARRAFLRATLHHTWKRQLLFQLLLLMSFPPAGLRIGRRLDVCPKDLWVLLPDIVA